MESILLERSLHYDGGMTRQGGASAGTDPQAGSARVEELYPGASVQRMRRGRHGVLWDPVASMPSGARDLLRQRLVPVAAAAFDGTTPEFWAEHWSDAQLDRLDVLHVAVKDDGDPVGWVSGRRARWGSRRAFYAASAGVAPDIQGGGVSADLWRRVVQRELRRQPLRPLSVVIRTGNPLVYDAWVAAAGDPTAVHPRPDTPVPDQVKAIARDAAAYLGQSAHFDPSRLHVTDAYHSTPSGLWRHRPRSRNQLTNAWFDTVLAPTDAFLVVARFHPLTQVTRVLRHKRH